METKHTPGPWKVDPKKNWDKVIRIENKGDGYHRLYVEVCRDDCDSDMAAANARLIATAPQMYEALQAVDEATLYNGEHFDNVDFSKLGPALELVKAAIAKAEGGAS